MSRKHYGSKGIRNSVWFIKYGPVKTVKCYWCGTELNFKQATTEHIIPLSEGGKDEMDNMDIACQTCNCYNKIQTFHLRKNMRNITVINGNNFELKLKENGTTGFTWFDSFDSASIERINSKFDPPDDSSFGAGGVRCFTYKSLKKGNTVITFTLKRYWQPDDITENKTVNVEIL